MRLKIWWLVIPILLLATWFAAPQLAVDALWSDEVMTHFMSTTSIYEPSSIVQLLLRTAVDRAWPPGFYLAMLGWENLVGGTLYVDRAIGLMFGLLAIATVYQLGRTVFTPMVGAIGALLLTTSGFFAFYLHEMRGYTMYVFFVAMASWLYWLLMKSSYHEKRWVRWGFAVMVAGALYTHYIAVGAVLGIIIYHFAIELPRTRQTRTDNEQSNALLQRWQVITRMGFIGCLTYVPWMAILLYSLFIEAENTRGEPPLRLLQSMIYGFTNNLWWIALPALVISLIWLRERDSIRFMWITGLSVLIVAMLGNLYASFLFHPRHIMGLMPAFMLLIAFTLWEFRRYSKPVVGVLIGIWAGAGILNAQSTDFMNQIPKHVRTIDIRFINTVQDTIASCVQPNDTVIMGIDVPAEEWTHDLTVTYYFARTNDYRIATVSHLLPDLDYYRLILSRELELAPREARIDYLTEQAENIWVISRTDVTISDELMTLDTILSDAGFEACGTFLERSVVNGQVYSRGERVTCDTIQLSCGD